MSKNLSIYPDDFSPTVKLGTTNIAGVITLESAVSSIEVQARDTALRQAHTRRISGQSSIANQNKFVRIGGLMPLYQVGATISSPRILGTVAYTGGTESHATSRIIDSFHKIIFANEATLKLDSHLSKPRIYCGTIGDLASGKYVGGYSHDLGQTFQSIDKITYATDKIQQVQARLEEPIVGIAGGMGDSARGILAGGISPETLMATKKGYTYTHATDSLFTLSSLLTRLKISIHNGFSSKNAGYMWIGSDRMWRDNWWYLGDGSIEKIAYSTGASNPVATAISSSAQNQIAHASLNSEVKGYVAGGWVTSPTPYYTDMITAFTFSGETSSVLNAKLTTAVVCVTGASCNSYGIAMGGNTVSDTWSGTVQIQKIRFDTETVEIFGSKLSVPYADQGSVSDWSPGFSY